MARRSTIKASNWKYVVGLDLQGSGPLKRGEKEDALSVYDSFYQSIQDCLAEQVRSRKASETLDIAGDGAFAFFRSLREAVTYALAVKAEFKRRLRELHHDDTPIKTGIAGLRSALWEVKPSPNAPRQGLTHLHNRKHPKQQPNYYLIGPAIDKAHRLQEAARGGHVLIEGSLREIIEELGSNSGLHVVPIELHSRRVTGDVCYVHFEDLPPPPQTCVVQLEDLVSSLRQYEALVLESAKHHATKLMILNCARTPGTPPDFQTIRHFCTKFVKGSCGPVVNESAERELADRIAASAEFSSLIPAVRQFAQHHIFRDWPLVNRVARMKTIAEAIITDDDDIARQQAAIRQRIYLYEFALVHMWEAFRFIRTVSIPGLMLKNSAKELARSKISFLLETLVQLMSPQYDLYLLPASLSQAEFENIVVLCHASAQEHIFSSIIGFYVSRVLGASTTPDSLYFPNNDHTLPKDMTKNLYAYLGSLAHMAHQTFPILEHDANRGCSLLHLDLLKVLMRMADFSDKQTEEQMRKQRSAAATINAQEAGGASPVIEICEETNQNMARHLASLENLRHVFSFRLVKRLLLKPPFFDEQELTDFTETFKRHASLVLRPVVLDEEKLH